MSYLCYFIDLFVPVMSNRSASPQLTIYVNTQMFVLLSRYRTKCRDGGKSRSGPSPSCTYALTSFLWLPTHLSVACHCPTLFAQGSRLFYFCLKLPGIIRQPVTFYSGRELGLFLAYLASRLLVPAVSLVTTAPGLRLVWTTHSGSIRLGVFCIYRFFPSAYNLIIIMKITQENQERPLGTCT